MITENLNESSNTVTCCYKEPKWSGICTDHEYGLDVLKNGVINDHMKLSGKPFFIIGRYKTCDFVMEHPSLSRFHSVLQYCSMENEEGKERGWYIMDLDSTHGTILNKKKIPSHTFIRIHTGHVLKFGGSTRLYIVTGPEEDKEPLSKYSWTELMELKKSKSQKVADANGYLSSEEFKTATGCMWGMNETVDDNDDISEEAKLREKFKHEQLYKDDPVKVIKTYFDKEGCDEGPQYEFNKVGFNKSVCKLELPVFGENGEKIIAEVSGSDKKKDMIVKCAFEACKILDEMEELFKAGGSRKRQKKDNKYYSEKDYYSSDEDDFFDRTGQIEEKRIQRMKRFGVATNKIESEVKEKQPVDAKNSDSVVVKFSRLEEINEEILTIEEQLEESLKVLEAGENASELDEIEKYLEAIQTGALNKKSRMKMRATIFELTREENLLRKQLKLSIPVTATMRKSLYQCKDRQERSEIDKKSKSVPDVTNAPKTIDNKKTSNQPVVVNSVNSKNDTVEIESDDDETNEIQIRNPLREDDAVKRKINEEEIKETPLSDYNPSREDDALKRKVNEKIKEVPVSDNKKIRLITETEEEDDGATWVPPAGQTGDGRTSLNDKYGY